MLSATRLLWLAVLALGLAAAPASARTGDDIDVEGPITALTDSSLTVAGLTFVVTPDTEIENDDGDPIPFSALTLGLFVEVEGYEAGDGTLYATEIEVEDDGGEVETEGVVTARSDSSLAVGGLTFGVTAATVVLDDDDNPIPYSEIVVGIRVKVDGRLRPDGSLVATEIERDDDDGDNDLEIEGLITALSPDSLTVGGTTFRLTAATVYVGDDDQPATYGDLAVGVRVEVHGVYGADGALTATRVELEDFDDDELEVTGLIEALSDSSLTVAARQFGVTGATVVLDDNRLPIPFSALTVGQLVEVRATVAPDGALVATHIKLEDGPGGDALDEIEARAALVAVTDSVAVVLGRPFVVTPATRIRTSTGAPGTLAGLPVGGLVEVRARREADGTLTALTLDAEDGDAAQVRFRAPVTAVTADSLDVLGVAFDAAAATVTGLDGLPATLADVLVGQVVRVTGTATDLGYTAATVEILRAATAGGRVCAPTASGFALPGVTVATTAATLVVNEAGVVLAPDAIAAGAAVRVSGTFDAAGALVASRVTVLAASAVVADEGAPAVAVALAAFPNPTAGAATLRVGLVAADVQVDVLDALGRVVLRAESRGAEVQLDTAGLPAGVYAVRAVADGRVVGTTRLTVVR